jgi:hypothetical protein
MSLSEKDRELVRLLNRLPFEESPVPNEKENFIIIIVLSAHEENAIDEYIDLVKENSDKSLNDIVQMLFSESKVEIVDDDTEEEDNDS